MSTTKQETLGNRIQKARVEKKLSPNQLAKKLDVSRGTIKNWESDESEPSARHLKAIAKLFSLSYNYLLDGKEGNDSSLALRLLLSERKKIDAILDVFTVGK